MLSNYTSLHSYLSKDNDDPYESHTYDRINNDRLQVVTWTYINNTFFPEHDQLPYFVWYELRDSLYFSFHFLLIIRNNFDAVSFLHCQFNQIMKILLITNRDLYEKLISARCLRLLVLFHYLQHFHSMILCADSNLICQHYLDPSLYN